MNYLSSYSQKIMLRRWPFGYSNVATFVSRDWIDFIGFLPFSYTPRPLKIQVKSNNFSEFSRNTRRQFVLSTVRGKASEADGNGER